MNQPNNTTSIARTRSARVHGLVSSSVIGLCASFACASPAESSSNALLPDTGDAGSTNLADSSVASTVPNEDTSDSRSTNAPSSSAPADAAVFGSDLDANASSPNDGLPVGTASSVGAVSTDDYTAVSTAGDPLTNSGSLGSSSDEDSDSGGETSATSMLSQETMTATPTSSSDVDVTDVVPTGTDTGATDDSAPDDEVTDVVELDAATIDTAGDDTSDGTSEVTSGAGRETSIDVADAAVATSIGTVGIGHDAGPSAPGLYAFSATTRLLSEYDSYVFITADLDADPEPEQAFLHIDSGVGPLVFGAAETGRFFISTSTGRARAVERYDVADDGSPIKTGSLSLDNAAAEYGTSFQLIDADTAYLMQPSELLVWNPDAMQLVTRIALDTELEDGVARTSATPIRIGDELFIGLGWVGASATVLGTSGVLVIDTQSDETTVVRDERCPYARDGVLGSDGYIYLGTEVYATTVHALNDQSAPAPCVVRFDPKTKTYDPTFQLDQFELADAVERPLMLGSLINSPGGETFVRLLDQSLIEGDSYAHSGARVLSSAGDVFRWARVLTGTAPTATLLDVAPTHGSVVPVMLGSRVFAPRFIWGPTDPEVPGANHWPMQTQYVELRDDGPTQPLFTIPGQSFSGVKVR